MAGETASVSRTSSDRTHRNTLSVGPRLVCRWSQATVVPDHNSSFPPATPPTDVIPADAKVSPLVDAITVPDGAAAVIEIRHAATDALVTGGTLNGLKVQGGRIIDPVTNNPPVWTFQATHVLWDPWDKPFYYFKARVDSLSLTGETTRDFTNQAAQCLRLLYSHLCVCDQIADTPAGGGLSTAAEMAEIAGILAAQTNHVVIQQPFNQANVPVNLWGSVMRNTYCYHHASHGDVVCAAPGDAGTQFNSDNDSNPTVCPNNAADPGRSVLVLGNTNLGGAEVNQAANVPSVPKYLVYIDTCVAGWEPSFANAFTSRGTRNVLAFKKYIPDGDARQMARDFYNKWSGTHKCNPEKIPDVFFDVGAPYYDSMRPILYGAGGGPITGSGGGLSPLATAAIIVGAVAAAALIGLAAYELLKK